jgi:DNA-binding MarR family transcriptional regulator
MTSPRPLPYWMRTIDRLIDHQVLDAVEAAGVDRRGWTVLCRLEHGAIRAEEVEELLAPYGGSGRSAADVLAELERAGLTESVAHDYRLTADGERRVEELQAGPVRAVVDRATADIDEAELDRTLEVLERVARNLGWLDED